MKKMERGQDAYPGDGYYRVSVADEGWGYYITIASDRANQMRTYEYDGGCGTVEEVEAELKKYTFEQIVKRYREQCVYLECVEELC